MMDELTLSCLVEGSEARAYASLLGDASIESKKRFGLASRWVAGTTAVVAEGVSGSLNMNRVLGLGVAEPATEALLDELVRPYLDKGLGYAVELSPRARPNDIVGWLRARRLRRVMPSVMHYRRADHLKGPATKLNVRLAALPEVAAVARLCCKTFRMPDAAGAALCDTANSPLWRHWVAETGGRLIAAGMCFVRDGVAWLGWDATAPEARGQGAQSALIAARVRDAATLGCRYVTAETAIGTTEREDPSMRNYRRLGFLPAYERMTYIALGRVGSRRSSVSNAASSR